MQQQSFSIFFLLCIPHLSTGLSIFQIAPGWSSSHILFNYRVAKMLSDHGHNVTLLISMMSHVSTSGAPKNVEVIKFTPVASEELRAKSTQLFQGWAFQEPNFTSFNEMGNAMRQLSVQICADLLNDHDLIDYLRSKKFDITLSHFFSSCPPGWSHRIGVPRFVWVATGAFIFESVAWKFGLPHLPSYMPSHMSKDGSDRMPFLERVKNTLWSALIDVFLLAEKYPLLQQSENNAFQQPPYNTDKDADLWTLNHRVITILINGEPFLDYPKPMLPGMMHLGDLESKVIKNLPENWQKLINEANDGVILFSFGTVANTSTMPFRLKEAFFKAFVKFPTYTIIWRLEGQLPSELKDHPHIHVVKWMPQSDLLHNKRIKLFITHGGYNSLLESVQAGVPMVLMPLLIDQYANAQRAKKRGIGLILDKYQSTSQDIENALTTVLTNASFAKNARYISSVLKDQIIPNEIAAVRQIEKIAASGRLWPTMKAVQKLNWIQYFCLDVAFVIISALAIVFYAIFGVCRSAWLLIRKWRVRK